MRRPARRAPFAGSPSSSVSASWPPPATAARRRPATSPSASPSPSPSVATTGRPEAFDAASLDTAFPIKHVVFLIKENRTFDNLFGTFPGANGVRVGNDNGRPRPLVRGTDGRTTSDIPHCYPCAISAWDGGRMDNFDQGVGGDWAYTQLHQDQLPNYWRWAQDFTLFDNFFASAQGPSFPNHLYSIAATSGRRARQPPADRVLLEHVRVRRAAQQLVEVVDSEGKIKRVPPCFDFLTEGDLLTRRGDPVGVLRGPGGPARLHLVRVQGDRPLPR